MRWPTVSITTPQGLVGVMVEIASTPDAIRYGLMHRDHLPWDAGMLFIMGSDRVWPFYMRDTWVPLDMIHIDRDQHVVGVVADTIPHDSRWRSIGAPSRYVLEVNAGWAAAHGVTVGSPVFFDGLEIDPRSGRLTLFR